MKKTLIILVVTAIQSNNQVQLSDLEVENVEALTNIEYIIEVGPLCTQMPFMMCHWEDGFEYPGQFL